MVENSLEIRKQIAGVILWVGSDCNKNCKVEYKDCMDCPVCNKYLDQILQLIKDNHYVRLVERKLPELMPVSPNNDWSAGYCTGERNMMALMLYLGFGLEIDGKTYAIEKEDK